MAEAQLYASRFRDADGREKITFRPPLSEALNAWFAAQNAPITISGGKQKTLDGVRVMIFQLTGMVTRDAKQVNACKLVKAAKVFDKKGKWVEDKGESATAGMRLPGYVGHGTDVHAGLVILATGGLLPTSGAAGAGVYFFGTGKLQQEGEKLEDDDLLKMWLRCAAGGYNEGCMVVCHCDGLVINKMKTQETPVPQGAVAHVRSQMSAHPGCLSYVSIVFCVDSLVAELAAELDAVGYTQKYHAGLLAVQAHLDNRASSWIPDEPTVYINNAVAAFNRASESHLEPVMVPCVGAPAEAPDADENMHPTDVGPQLDNSRGSDRVRYVPTPPSIGPQLGSSIQSDRNRYVPQPPTMGPAPPTPEVTMAASSSSASNKINLRVKRWFCTECGKASNSDESSNCEGCGVERTFPRQRKHKASGSETTPEGGPVGEGFSSEGTPPEIKVAKSKHAMTTASNPDPRLLTSWAMKPA